MHEHSARLIVAPDDLGRFDAGLHLGPCADRHRVAARLELGVEAQAILPDVGDPLDEMTALFGLHLVEVDLLRLHQLEEGRCNAGLEQAAVPVLGDRFDVLEDVDHGALGYAR